MNQKDILEYLEEEIGSRREEFVARVDAEISFASEKAVIDEHVSRIIFDSVTLAVVKSLRNIVEEEIDPVRAVAKCMRHISILRDHLNRVGSNYSDIIVWVLDDLNSGFIEILDPDSKELEGSDIDKEDLDFDSELSPCGLDE